MALIRPDPDKLDVRFLLYYFFTDEWRAVIRRNMLTGATVDRIPLTSFPDFPVRVPPLPIQNRIADILSAYDELMENSQRRIRILEAMARALYREWFIHFRFPGHEKLPRVASPLGDIPQGWEVVSIDDVCSRVTDGSHHSPKSVDEGLPMASSKDMHDWGLNLETCRLISPEDFADLVRNDCKPKRNDVLVTKDGANYLKYIFVTRAEQEVVLLSSVAILRPNARISPHLLAAILKEPENKGRLKNYVTGAAIPRVILKDFKRFELLLPSEGVQRAWARIAEPMTEQIWRLIDKIQNLRRTRDLLLPRLLSGQIDVKAAEASTHAHAEGHLVERSAIGSSKSAVTK
jgi:type I restriction enzyme, S subunit